MNFADLFKHFVSWGLVVVAVSLGFLALSLTAHTFRDMSRQNEIRKRWSVSDKALEFCPIRGYNFFEFDGKLYNCEDFTEPNP